MNTIFETIKDSFDSLWICRQRGESLEIITPFATASEMYVSVFLTRRNGNWIVSDGGWVNNGVYCKSTNIYNETAQKIIESFIEDYDIRVTFSPRGTPYYYKAVDSDLMVPNIVFDLATFISQSASVVNSIKEDEEPRERKHRFSSHVRKFLTDNITDQEISFNQNIADIKFNVVVETPNQGMSLINLVSGDFHNMRQGFASSNMKFDMLGFSDLPADCIRNRIVIVDDSILPLDSKELQPLVSLTKNKGQHPVSWNTSRDKIMELIA